MEKIIATDINASRNQMLARMYDNIQISTLEPSSDVMAVQPASGEFEHKNLSGVSFSGVLDKAINAVNVVQQSASAKQTAVDMGESDDLAGAMLESQKASVAFSALVQVRNKLTTALDEIMNIPL